MSRRQSSRRLRASFFAVLVMAGLGGVAPGAQAPPGTPGITRATLFENGNAQVVRVTFAAGAREVVHTHPNDILIIQDTPGDMELMIANKTTKGSIEHGKVTLVPKGAQHWAGNIGRKAFDLIVVHLKDTK